MRYPGWIARTRKAKHDEPHRMRLLGLLKQDAIPFPLRLPIHCWYETNGTVKNEGVRNQKCGNEKRNLTDVEKKKSNTLNDAKSQKTYNSSRGKEIDSERGEPSRRRIAHPAFHFSCFLSFHVFPLTNFFKFAKFDVFFGRQHGSSLFEFALLLGNFCLEKIERHRLRTMAFKWFECCNENPKRKCSVSN